LYYSLILLSTCWGKVQVSVEYLLTGTDKPEAVSNPQVRETVKHLILLDDFDREAVEVLARTLAKRRKV
jgi:hypothetical protein